MELLWFVLIAILWIGYFVLEGFDFGVAMLLPILGRTSRSVAGDEADGDAVTSGQAGRGQVESGNDRRRLMLTTIGPHWDGNEVWLLTAGGATFAAFPHWYATLFSGFYLALLLILIALTVRGVGLEYRHKRADIAWQRRWDVAISVGSWLPAFLWGVAFTNIVVGVPIDERMEYTGNLLTLLNPLALLGGLASTALFLTHGAGFLALKTVGALSGDARRLAARLGMVAIPLVASWIGLVVLTRPRPLAWGLAVLAAAALVGSIEAVRRARDGWAFALTSLATAAGVAALFAALFPHVLPSTSNPAWSLTYLNAASSTLTLRIMTGAAAVFTPIVLAYTGYTYWVFRRRIGIRQLARPAELTGCER